MSRDKEFEIESVDNFQPAYFDRQLSKSDAKIAWQYERMLRFAGIRAVQGLRVLDIGCGAAPGLRYFVTCGARAVGVDVSRAALAAARRVLPGARVALIERADQLPFPAGSFDLVVLSEIVEHVPSNLPFLRECRRVLRPGGVATLTTPNLWDVRRFVGRMGGAEWSGWRDPTHINLQSPRTLRRDLLAAGFARVRLKSGWKPLLRVGGRRLRATVSIPYPPLIGNGILAAAWA